ncbi:unnamed protein product [Lota lota]
MLARLQLRCGSVFLCDSGRRSERGGALPGGCPRAMFVADARAVVEVANEEEVNSSQLAAQLSTAAFTRKCLECENRSDVLVPSALPDQAPAGISPDPTPMIDSSQCYPCEACWEQWCDGRGHRASLGGG